MSSLLCFDRGVKKIVLEISSSSKVRWNLSAHRFNGLLVTMAESIRGIVVRSCFGLKACFALKCRWG